MSWQASHDLQEKGWNLELLAQTVRHLSRAGKVMISAEGELPAELRPFAYSGPPEKIHHLLAHLNLFVGESATMASECAALGVPAIYVANTGRGYTDEQEARYRLVANVREFSWQHIQQAMDKILATPPEQWQKRRIRLLEDKINVSSFVAELVLNYPSSVDQYRDSPNLAAVGSNPGYLEIKSGNSLSSTSHKSYFKFDVGSNPNTNANAIFTLVFPTITPASQSQRVQLYALNQAYAGGFNPATMTWNNAQANNTNNLSAFLTDPTNTYTATPLVSVVLAPADSTHTSYTFTLQGGTNATSWGNFIKNGKVTLALTGVPDAALNANGPVRSPTNASTLTFHSPIGGGSIPSISACTNVTTYPTFNSPTNYFTVSGSGLNLPPTATSDNQTVVVQLNCFGFPTVFSCT